MERRTISSVQYLNPEQQQLHNFSIHDSGLYNERTMVDQWFQLPLGKIINTVSHQEIVILNHGRMNKNKGPDIKHAALFMDGIIDHGDIECHIREQSWFSHGHDKDENYKNVILHLVHHPVQSGHHPVSHTAVFRKINNCKCSLSIANISETARRYLKKLGEQRWCEKVERFRKKYFLTELGTILGQEGNEENFKCLISHLQTSHLLSMPRDDQMTYIKKKAGDLNIQWEGCGIRPAQRPENRYKLLVEILSFKHTMLKQPFPNAVSFFKTLQHQCPSGGYGILVELCINVFYPFMAGEALKHNDINEYSRWKEAWQLLKLNTPYGKFTRRYSHTFLKSDLKNGSVVQGMIAMDRQFCKLKYCDVCPLKNFDDRFKQN